MADPREPSEIQRRLALVEAQLQQLFEHLDIAPREGEGEAHDESKDAIDAARESLGG